MIKVRIRVPLYVDPFGDNDIAKKKGPPKSNPNFTPFYTKGNNLAARATMDEDSDKRRMAGLFKTWAHKWRENTERRATGAEEMKKRTAAQERERHKIAKITVAKEAREVQEMARQTATQALEVIKDVLMNGQRDSDKLAAANIILERAHGKATQINVNENVNRNGSKNEVSAEELDKRIETAIARTEELTARAEKLTGGKTKSVKGAERPVNLRQRNRNTGGPSIH